MTNSWEIANIFVNLLRAHHDAGLTIILAWRGRDHAARLGRRRASERQHEAPHARVPRAEPVVIDQVLPDRHRVSAAPERLGDELAIRLARARSRRATRPWHQSEVGGHLFLGGRFWRPGVGRHLHGNCRFWV